MADEALYREMMRRFAPQPKKRALVLPTAAIVEDAVEPKKKKCGSGRKPANGASFPIEIWAKIPLLRNLIKPLAKNHVVHHQTGGRSNYNLIFPGFDYIAGTVLKE